MIIIFIHTVLTIVAFFCMNALSAATRVKKSSADYECTEKMSPYKKILYIDTQILAIFCVRALIDNISNKFFIMCSFFHSRVCILRALSFDFVVTCWIALLSGITLHIFNFYGNSVLICATGRCP
jgi:hypothetical protein